MVENYTKDIKESDVISALAVGYTMLGKTLIKMSPPSLSKFDLEEGDNWRVIFGELFQSELFWRVIFMQIRLLKVMNSGSLQSQLSSNT